MAARGDNDKKTDKAKFKKKFKGKWKGAANKISTGSRDRGKICKWLLLGRETKLQLQLQLYYTSEYYTLIIT